MELNGEEGAGSTKTADRKGDLFKKDKMRDYWYMISSDWLFKWKCFVTNKISKAVNQNILHEIK